MKYIAQKCYGLARGWMLHVLVARSLVTCLTPGSVFSDSP